MKKPPIPHLPIQGLIIRCLAASGATLAAGCPLPGLAVLPSVAAHRHKASPPLNQAII